MKYFSIFSGIGGFEYGLCQSKHQFECVGFSEVDTYAESIYLRHFPKHKNFGDATKINPKELQDFDLLVGGFPCQAFSQNGKRKGFDDTRGTLFFEIARILKEKKPEYFLFENVKGMLSHDNGNTFTEILRILSELGYDVEWEVFNSKSFGIPQRRERLYIKGYFRNGSGSKILSQKRNRNEIDVCLTDKNHAESNGSQFLLKIKTNTVKGYDEATEGDGVLLCHPSSKTARGRTQKECVGALSTGCDWGVITSDYRIRRLTPKECERLQGFPDNWTKYGKNGEIITDTQRYKCVGNAVTTKVVTYIINEMFSGGNNEDR